MLDFIDNWKRYNNCGFTPYEQFICTLQCYESVRRIQAAWWCLGGHGVIFNVHLHNAFINGPVDKQKKCLVSGCRIDLSPDREKEIQQAATTLPENESSTFNMSSV